MRNLVLRLAVVVGGVAIVASCDSRLSTSPITVGPSGSSSNSGVKGPVIAIDTPAVGSLINVGDSLLVVVRLHDDKALTTATIQGLKIVAGEESSGTPHGREQSLHRAGHRKQRPARMLRAAAAKDTDAFVATCVEHLLLPAR